MDSDLDSELAKAPIPLHLTKWSTTVSSIPDSKQQHYCFNLKLKPESVLQWDRNLDTLARWISRINCLMHNTPEIEALGKKIVPQRSINFSKTWYYYSILVAEGIRIEEIWTTSGIERSILEYWMNHHWLEKQKLRVNIARFIEAGQRESPGEYIICKMGHLMLVYSYANIETF